MTLAADQSVACEPVPEARPCPQRTMGTLTDENTDAGAEVELEKLETKTHRSSISAPSRRTGDCDNGNETTDKVIVRFARDDPENPYNWSTRKKAYVLVTGILLVMNSTLGSAIPAGASQETQEYFHIDNQSLLVLPVSIFLVGYVLGPLVFAPMSESFGRKWVVMATFITFTAFNLGCALSPTFAGLIIMRLLVGISASTPISVIGGVFADIHGTPKARGRAMTLFMAATTWGPLVGPIISGFISVKSWRWTYFVALIIAGATWPLLVFLPETYGPVLLLKKARRLRKQTGNNMIFAPVELEGKQSWQSLCTVVLTRPVRMFLFEWIVLFSCLYLSVAYAIFYMFFQAYPIIYEGTYGFNAGEEGITFLPIGVGAVIAGAIYLYWERLIEKIRARSPPPAWAKKEEYARLPIACLGAPLLAVSLFWLGWTARPDIHWIVPTLSALPFGIGFLLIFIALINYIVDAYEVFAASALAGASCSRSVFGVVLPFAARPMYETLGIGWSCSLLGFVSIAMGVVPFIFIVYGENIRANSTWCQELKEQKAAREEAQERVNRQQHSTETKHLHVQTDPEKGV